MLLSIYTTVFSALSCMCTHLCFSYVERAAHLSRRCLFPLPSQEAMAKTIGKGGNGVVAFIYHGGREFAVKETGLRQEELETWSSVNHRNVIEICAVIEGDWDSACPGARRCYQMMPRVTGEYRWCF